MRIVRCLCGILAGLGLIYEEVALAADWAFIDFDSEDSAYFIDKESISDRKDWYGEFRVAWIKILVNQSKYKKYNKKLVFNEIKCSTLEMRPVSYVTYDSNENRLDSYSNKTQPFEPVIPDSIGAAILKVACR